VVTGNYIGTDKTVLYVANVAPTVAIVPAEDANGNPIYPPANGQRPTAAAGQDDADPTDGLGAW
jgi:hypothetical protein